MSDRYFNRILAATLLGALSMAAAPSTIAASGPPAADMNSQWLTTMPMTTPMRRALEPGTIPDVVNSVIQNPAQIVDSPMASCAGCHEGNDLARYGKTIAPMMQFMNPRAWNNPAAFSQAMGAMMNPATYTEWFAVMLGKFNQMANFPQPKP